MLAKKLTYISCGDDAVIRMVTMDYGEIENLDGRHEGRLISELELPVYEVTWPEVEAVLAKTCGGEEIRQRIHKGFQSRTNTAPEVQPDPSGCEYGTSSSAHPQPNGKTWTLVILSDLKPTGQNLKAGILRRMLASALPLGTDMAIYLNGERLMSPKVNFPVTCEWVIGPELEFETLTVASHEDTAPDTRHSGQLSNAVETEAMPAQSIVSIEYGNEDVPYAKIPGIGRITGRVRLYRDKISGGKSEKHGASNGFLINVRGRLVNQGDPSFGEKNLSHAAWARFRMTVRADGLDDFITTNREQFQDRREVSVFRAFLRKAFNKARGLFDDDKSAVMPDGGDYLVRNLGFVSLKPLQSVVSESLRMEPPFPDLFDESDITDREAHREEWLKSTTEDIGSALGEVRFGEYADASFVKYKVSDRSIVVNKKHPFVQEHARGKAGKILLRNLAMITVLSDVQGINIGIDPRMMDTMRGYRDSLMRYSAVKDRRSGDLVWSLLLRSHHDNENFQLLEAASAEALRYLGFEVTRMGKSGEPDGLARAHLLPPKTGSVGGSAPTPNYSFTYDTKATGKSKVKTNNVRLDAIVQHRDMYKADYALVIAPDFASGSSIHRFEAQRVTPLKTRDLGTLLQHTVRYGAVSLGKLQEMFELYDPCEVSYWVAGLDEYLRSNRRLTIDVFLKALVKLKEDVTDELPPALIGMECNRIVGRHKVKSDDVRTLAKGLEGIAPDLIAYKNGQIELNTTAVRLRETVMSQLENREYANAK